MWAFSLLDDFSAAAASVGGRGKSVRPLVYPIVT